MDIVKCVPVPTGHILVVQGQHGLLEMLSIGDYGKDVNLKCDAMGLIREPSPVKHTRMLPLSEKWVITISTQYGCNMGCTFCDVPKVGPGKNATMNDMINQVIFGCELHPEVLETKRLNVHFARMGEPSWNMDVITAAITMLTDIPKYDGRFLCKLHPVVSTMMPVRNHKLETFVNAWVRVKNDIYGGEAGLQISVNSTDEAERMQMFGGHAHTLGTISNIMRGLKPVGRKFTLNFALADYTIDPDVLLKFFDPRYYIIKLTPMHRTCTAVASGIETSGDPTTYAPYKEHEERLKAAGYDVLVFIASHEEDASRITCGNAILADKEEV